MLNCFWHQRLKGAEDVRFRKLLWDEYCSHFHLESWQPGNCWLILGQTFSSYLGQHFAAKEFIEMST